MEIKQITILERDNKHNNRSYAIKSRKKLEEITRTLIKGKLRDQRVDQKLKFDRTRNKGQHFLEGVRVAKISLKRRYMGKHHEMLVEGKKPLFKQQTFIKEQQKERTTPRKSSNVIFLMTLLGILTMIITTLQF